MKVKGSEVYKKLLRVLAEYLKTSPATGMERLFDILVEQGSKILPKDQTALSILNCVITEDSPGSSIHRLMNIRFSNCDIKPLIKKNKKHEVASWTRGKLTSDRVKDLINWEGESGSGNWSDADGEKVTVIDMLEEK